MDVGALDERLDLGRLLPLEQLGGEGVADDRVKQVEEQVLRLPADRVERQRDPSFSWADSM